MSITELGNTVGAFVPLLAGLGGAVSGAKFIQEGERGVKLRFGKVRRRRNGEARVYRPGFAFVIPGVDSLRRTHVRTRTVNLPIQEVVLTDRMEFQVGGIVRFHVSDTPAGVYAALFETIDLNTTVSDYVSARLRDVLAGMSYEEVLAREGVTTQVTDLITKQLAEWGLERIEFSLSDCSPTPQSARAMLIAAETAMRGEALTTVAAKLAGDRAVQALSPTVAAALIGTPVVTSLDGGGSQE